LFALGRFNQIWNSSSGFPDPRRTKYDLAYYVTMAKELVQRGTHLLAKIPDEPSKRGSWGESGRARWLPERFNLGH